MADRVFFATVQDSVTPSNDSGFDDFPIPFIQSAPGSLNPIAVALDDAIEWWWRIKNWSLSTNIVVTNGATNTPMPSGDMTPDSANAQTESDLEFPIGHVFDLTGAGELQIIGSILQNGGALYPEIFFNSTLGIGAVVGFDSVGPGFPYVAAGSFTGTIKGYSITVYMWRNTTTGTTIAGSSFVLTPIEWWPYSNSTGLPIWVTTTGVSTGVDPRS